MWLIFIWMNFSTNFHLIRKHQCLRKFDSLIHKFFILTETQVTATTSTHGIFYPAWRVISSLTFKEFKGKLNWGTQFFRHALVFLVIFLHLTQRIRMCKMTSWLESFTCRKVCELFTTLFTCLETRPTIVTKTCRDEQKVEGGVLCHFNRMNFHLYVKTKEA